MDTHAHTYKYCQAKCKAKRKHDELGNIKCKGVIQGWVLWSVNAPTHMHTRTHTHIYTVSMGVWCHVWIYIYIYLFIFILHHTPHPPTGCHFRKMLCFKKFFFFFHISLFVHVSRTCKATTHLQMGREGVREREGAKERENFLHFRLWNILLNLEVTALAQRKAGDGLPGEVVEDEEDVFRAAISLRNSCLSEENMAKGNGILKKETSVSNLSWPLSPWQF